MKAAYIFCLLALIFFSGCITNTHNGIQDSVQDSSSPDINVDRNIAGSYTEEIPPAPPSENLKQTVDKNDILPPMPPESDNSEIDGVPYSEENQDGEDEPPMPPEI